MSRHPVFATGERLPSFVATEAAPIEALRRADWNCVVGPSALMLALQLQAFGFVRRG
jgi:hypothetical protein